MRAEEVLAAQQDLVGRLDHSPVFRRYVGTAFAMGFMPDGARTDREDPAFRRSAEAVASRLTQALRAGYVFQVTADMCLLLQHAAEQLDGTDRFERHSAPTQAGFCRFERPLPVREIGGRTMLLHWLAWGPASGGTAEGAPVSGVMAYWFNDMVDGPDEVAEDSFPSGADDPDPRATARGRATVGRWGTATADFLTDQMRVGPQAVIPSAELAARRLAAGEPSSASTNTVRYVTALFLLLGQSVTAKSEMPVRRTAARYARRMGMPSGVTVISLRRSEHANRREGESLVEWSHRWVVRGHWRWQPYGEGRKERRRIWIAPFVKGPDGAPLVVTDKLYRLAR